MRVNVIMPTNRSPEELIPVLESYKLQKYRNFVISIIKEGDLHILKNMCKKLDIHNVRLFSIPKGTSNASIARNCGLAHALDNEIILFSDDDMLVSPSFIAEHVNIHLKNECAVVRGLRYQKNENGNFYLTIWERDAIKRWHQPKRKDIWAYFVTSNASVSNHLLKKTGYFDVNFDKSGCEDTDLAYRLLNVGGKSISNEKAINYHLSIDNLQLKFKSRVKNFKYFQAKYPNDPAVKLFVHLTMSAIEKKLINHIFLRNSEEF